MLKGRRIAASILQQLPVVSDILAVKQAQQRQHQSTSSAFQPAGPRQVSRHSSQLALFVQLKLLTQLQTLYCRACHTKQSACSVTCAWDTRLQSLQSLLHLKHRQLVQVLQGAAAGGRSGWDVMLNEGIPPYNSRNAESSMGSDGASTGMHLHQSNAALLLWWQQLFLHTAGPSAGSHEAHLQQPVAHTHPLYRYS